MSTNPNTPAGNPDNFNEKQAVFEEIFTWLRHINNSVWLITSFFIGLNLATLKTMFSKSDNSKIVDFLKCLTCEKRIFLAVLIFTALWLIPAFCVLRLMTTSNKLSSLLEKGLDSLQITKLYNKLGERARLTEVLEGTKYPYGRIITAFTILFLYAWIWTFYFIP